MNYRAYETFTFWMAPHALCSSNLYFRVLRKTGHAAFTLVTNIHNYSACCADSALLLFTSGRNLIPSPETTQYKNKYNVKISGNYPKISFVTRAIYTGCPRRNVPDFGRVFLMLKYTDITQNTYVQIWTVTEIMTREVWNSDSCYTLIID